MTSPPPLSLAPVRRTRRCAQCRKYSALVPPEDIDPELDAALAAAGAVAAEEGAGRWLCGCALRKLREHLAAAGWEELHPELASEVARPLAAARIPRRVWPSSLVGVVNTEPWVASATWVPEWVCRVLEVRLEGVFTRGDGRVWLTPHRLRAALRLWHAEPELVAASMTVLRLSGPEEFGRFVLTAGARMTDQELEEA